MSRIYDNSWFRGTLLLAALAAGFMLTRVVPTYEEMAAVREQSAAPAAERKTHHHTTSGVTGLELNQRHLEFVRSIT
jgi:hypothetical protein